MHEVTVATIDKPKLLSQLSALLADVGLNIREAHVFSTVDGYSLDVFVVDGWPTEVFFLYPALISLLLRMHVHYSEPQSCPYYGLLPLMSALGLGIRIVTAIISLLSC
jgi:hypothetical protein